MMVNEMTGLGCKKEDMVAKIFGGSNMFPNLLKMTIGDDNVVATKENLQKLKIPLLAQETGGNVGRSVWFDGSDGSVVVGKVSGETKQY